MIQGLEVQFRAAMMLIMMDYLILSLDHGLAKHMFFLARFESVRDITMKYENRQPRVNVEKVLRQFVNMENQLQLLRRKGLYHLSGNAQEKAGKVRLTIFTMASNSLGLLVPMKRQILAH